MSVAVSLSKRAAVRLLAAMLLALPALVHAQDQTNGLLDTPERPSRLEQLRQRMPSSSASTVPLEGALDPTAYVVGPGDVFNVFIGGSTPVTLSQPVSAGGELVLPEVGSIEVAGQTLARVRQRALEALRARFSGNATVEVTLSRPREFYVHVSGAVPVPGRYLASPVTRISTVLDQAFIDTTQAPVTNPSYRPSLRNITITRRDGSEESVDLVRYFATGNPQHNPYLRDGDVISVPAYDPDRDAVYVDGAIASPGTYDYRSGDTILDLLRLASGEQALRNLGEVRLMQRSASAQASPQVFNVSALLADEDDSVRVQPLDHLYVLPKERERGTATIKGAVQYPGQYPIVPGETQLRELLASAGGLLPDALERGAYLERASLPDTETPSRLPNRFEYAATRLRRPRMDTTAALFQRLRLADLDFLSRSYLTKELRFQNRVSVNLNEALASSSDPVYLQDGDRLVVPRDDQTVFVFGQVNQPGYVNYAPNRNVGDYIAAADGRGTLAGETYVIKAGTGRYLPASEAEVQSGDMIFINRAEDLAASAEMQRLMLQQEQTRLQEERTRADTRYRTVQTIVQVVGTVATVVTTYLLIDRQTN